MKYGYYDTNRPRFLRSEKVRMVIGLVVMIFAIYGVFQLFGKIISRRQVKIISPRSEIGQSAETQGVTPTPIYFTTPTPTATPTPLQRPTRGKASYYSREGCLGCSDTLTMANGEVLDDTKLTVAYNHAPLNSTITITNTKTNKSVVARVTDRGGFERHGKIIDLSVATKQAIGCGDVCNVILDF
jgi:rare lipoprotein A (peptidoglycan hydrolase)